MHNQETSNPCEETGSTGTNEEVMQEEVTPKCEIEHESSGKDLTLSPDLLKKPVEIVRSGSHRAGFDAFMTGFILDYVFCTCTSKLSNQNNVFVGYSVLIGSFLSTSTKIILNFFMTLRSG
jgi:hypothetical protein